jgi:hypothetical protein
MLHKRRRMLRALLLLGLLLPVRRKALLHLRAVRRRLLNRLRERLRLLRIVRRLQVTGLTGVMVTVLVPVVVLGMVTGTATGTAAAMRSSRLLGIPSGGVSTRTG